LNSAAIAEYLAFGYTSGEQTMFAGIHKLMPGHTLLLSTAGEPKLDIQQYWDAPRVTEFDQRSEAELIAETRSRLEETVRMRLMSDVPLGMFLSGGIDSSLIAAIMKRMVSGPVQTFAVGYSEAEFSELGYARQVANAIGTDHHEIVIGMEDFVNTLPKLIWHEDEPITWPSSVSLYFVASLAARNVKVVLTGEGSDELFAGYGRYRFYDINRRWAGPYSAVPAFLRNNVQSFLRTSSLLSAPVRRKLEHTILGRTADVKSLYLDNFYCAFSEAELQALTPGHDASSAYDSFLKYWARGEGSSLVTQMLYADQKTYLVELLMKQDQMSMACSIESRVPFLDHKFVEFAGSVPPHIKLRGGTGKYILKKAAEDLLPKEIIYRKKMGFPTPLRDWLTQSRSQPIYDALRDPNGLVASLVDKAALENLIHRQQNGLEDATDRFWRLLNLQLWADVYLNGRREQVWDGLLPKVSVPVAG
jgi:asparagine synthase (glutamine-hydrolysing)